MLFADPSPTVESSRFQRQVSEWNGPTAPSSMDSYSVEADSRRLDSARPLWVTLWPFANRCL